MGVGLLVFLLGTFTGIAAFMGFWLRRTRRRKSVIWMVRRGPIIAVVTLLIYIGFGVLYIWSLAELPAGTILGISAIRAHSFANSTWVAQFLLGVIGGFLFGKWLDSISVAGALHDESSRIAHKRLGLALLSLLFVGGFTEAVGTVVRNIQSFSTPVLSVDVSGKEQDTKIIHATEPAYLQAGQDSIPKDSLRQRIERIARQIETDIRYLKSISGKYLPPGIVNFHKIAPVSINSVLVPATVCYSSFTQLWPKRFRAYPMNNIKLDDEKLGLSNLFQQGNLLPGGVFGWNPGLVKSASGENQYDPPCKKGLYTAAMFAELLPKSLEKHSDLPFRDLPYGAMIRSELLLEEGFGQEAARELAVWLEPIYRCHKPGQRCDAKKDTQIKLPLWYAIRAGVMLKYILRNEARLEDMIEVIEENISVFERIINTSSHLRGLNIGKFEHWVDRCPLGADEGLFGEENDEGVWLDRVMFSYAVETSELVRHTISTGRSMSNRLLDYARRNIEIPPGCFDQRIGPIGIKVFQRDFNFTYGTALLKSLTNSIRSTGEFGHLRDEFRVAESSLRRAYELGVDLAKFEESRFHGQSLLTRLDAPREHVRFREIIRQQLSFAERLAE